MKKTRAKKIKLIQIIGETKFKKSHQYFIDLVKGLDKKKFEITCIAPPGDLLSKLKKIKQIEIRAISMVKRWDFHALSKIRETVKEINKNGQAKAIIHCHGDRAGQLGRLACVSTWRKAPYIIYTESQIASVKFLTILRLWFLDLFTNNTITFSAPVVEFLIKKRITRPEKIVMLKGEEKEGKEKSSSAIKKLEEFYKQV